MSYFVQRSELESNHKSLALAVVLSMFFGALGLHRFYMGRKLSGAIILASTFLTAGIALFIWVPLTMIEAVALLVNEQPRATHAQDSQPGAASAVAQQTATISDQTRPVAQMIVDVSRPQTMQSYPREKQEVEIYDVSAIETPAIQKSNAATQPPVNEAGGTWINRLQIPYERHNLKIDQLRQAVYGVYEQLAEYIDQELRKHGSSLDYLIRHIPRDSYAYYDNLLYTIFCIAEGHVTGHYAGDRGYDNSFSYSLLVRRTGSDLATQVQQYANDIVKQLPPAGDDIKRVFGLTPNGLPMEWWDSDGQLRDHYEISDAVARLLRITPTRSTRIFEIPEVRMHIFRQYVAALAILKQQRHEVGGWKVRIGTYVDKVFNGSGRYVDNPYNFLLLSHILKLCEQAVREALPYTRSLDTDKELAALRKAIPKDAANAVILAASTIETPIKVSDGTLRLLAEQNPSAWKVDVANIAEKPPEFVLSMFQKYTDPAVSLKIAKEIIKSRPDTQTQLAALYSAQVANDGSADEWTIKQLKRLIHPEQMVAYQQMVATKKPVDSSLLHRFDVLNRPPRRKVMLDGEKMAQAAKDHNRAVESVTTYLGDETEDESEPRIPDAAQEKPVISTDALYGTSPTMQAADLSDDQGEFLRMVISAPDGLELSQAVSFARSRNKMLNGYLQAINKTLYDVIGDQVLLQEDGRIIIEQEYIDTVKGMI